jgi:hypothetical protein
MGSTIDGSMPSSPITTTFFVFGTELEWTGRKNAHERIPWRMRHAHAGEQGATAKRHGHWRAIRA